MMFLPAAHIRRMWILPELCLLALISACETTSSDTKPKLSPEEQAKVDEYAVEVELGRNMAGRLMQFLNDLNDAEEGMTKVILWQSGVYT